MSNWNAVNRFQNNTLLAFRWFWLQAWLQLATLVQKVQLCFQTVQQGNINVDIEHD